MGISVESTRYSRENMAQYQPQSSNGGNPEEGEIVDDFDDIISSDEELSMRKRIEELEARNSELEKLANISGYYNNYGASNERYKSGHAAIDKILSGDFPRSAPNLYAKQRRSLPQFNHVERYKPHNPAIFQLTPPPPPIIPRKHEYSSPQFPQYSPRSYHSTRKRKYEKAKRNKSGHKKQRTKSRKKARLDYTISSDDEIYSLDRNNLRKAVQYEPVAVKIESSLPMKKRTSTNSNKHIETDDDVIVVNDNAAEKQEKSDDSESSEIKELRLIALKSAFLRKNRKRKQRKEIEQKTPYSPTDFLQPMPSLDSEISSPKEFMDMEISPIASPGNFDDGLPIDMELVESGDSSNPEFVEQRSYWTPIHPVEEIPLPGSPKNSPPHYKSIISPIAVRSAAFLMPPNHTVNDAGSETDDEKVQIVSDENASAEQTDEEELALRALLLAQKSSPKFPKHTKTTIKPSVPPPEPKPKKIEPLDPLKAIYEISQGPPTKTAEILKEAVKRLQNKSADEEHLKLQDSTNTIPTVNHSNSIQPIVTQYPKDVDYRLPSAYVSNTPTVELPMKTLQVTQTSANRSIPPANIQIKENVYSRGTRPNNIEIIPMKNVQRTTNKPSLSDITEIDNVAVEKVGQIVKPKSLQMNAKLDNQPVESLEGMSTFANKDTLDINDRALEILEISRPNTDELSNSASEENREDIMELEKSKSKKSEVPTTDPPQITVDVKRQRKRSITSLEILQLKTQNLISSGKFVSRNKIVAAKLLNKALHHNALAAKRKITQKPKPIEDARLIKTIDVPQVKPIVINVNSKSESDSDDDFNDGYAACHETTSAKPESDHNDLYDVASPISLPMESPRDSPLTVPASNLITIIEPLVSTEEKTAIDNVQVKTKDSTTTSDGSSKVVKKEGTFEAKLEEFLKNARSKVELCKKNPNEVMATTPIAQKTQKVTNTPAAVKHLPISSQLEYRRLISRMQMLEKQKLAKTLSSTPAKEKTLKRTINNNLSPQKVSSEPNKVNATLNNTSSAINDTKITAISSQSTRIVHNEKKVTIKTDTEVQVTVKNELAKNIQPAFKDTEAEIANAKEKESSNVPAKTLLPDPVAEIQNQKSVTPLTEKSKSLEGLWNHPVKIPSKVASISKPTMTIQKPATEVASTKPIQTVVKKVLQQPKPANTKPKVKVTPAKVGVAKVMQAKTGIVKATQAKARTVKTTPAKAGTVKTTPAMAGIVKPTPAKTGIMKQTPAKAGIVKPTPIKAGTVKLTPAKVATSNLKIVKPIPAKKLKVIIATKSTDNQNAKPIEPAVPTLPLLNETRTSLECEKQYRESSCNLLDNISKTIKLVVAAQIAKREKAQLEQEQEELRKKMLEIEMKIKEKHNAISEIYPKISTSHKLIVALKDRTTNLDQLSIDLSKRLGENRNNSFYMEQKERIKSLSKDLSVEIKKLKDINVSNLNVEGVVNDDAITPLKQDEAIQVKLINEHSDIQGRTDSIDRGNCDTEKMVSSITDQLVSGNLNKPDTISPSSSSILPKQMSTNELTTIREKLVKTRTEKENSPLLKSDKNNVQSSLETDKDKENPVNEEPKLVVMPDAPEKAVSAILPRLYNRMCGATKPEDQRAKQNVGHKSDYISPLSFSAGDTGSVNPHGILCPYQLMGQCDDKECKYEHLDT